MSKGAGRNIRQVMTKIDHGGKMFKHIPAQMASPAPPLGSQLGQIGVNINDFVRDFNLKTSVFKPGVPIPTYVTINSDRSYNMSLSHPPWPYLIMQAAGIQRGAMDKDVEVAGYITRRHVYEIARLKSEDPLWQMFDLRIICDKIVDYAHGMGVQVVDAIDPVWYAEFLQERQGIIVQQKADLEAKREAKLLRTAQAAEKEAKREKELALKA
eukprot:maker-scaffold90_size386344-snap-gene-1.23 protein:Tk12047 transcript:maker-scaffold90_size386344-snap-gene-1.23-mRNA-1 annotation:"39s ribosomal protein mitochondrial precursor"